MDVVKPVVLEKGLKTTFYLAYDAATPLYPEISTEVPSSADQEKYAWLGTAPTMRKWVDERVPKGLLDHSYTIENDHFEASLSINRDTLEDDLTGQLNFRVQDMGQRTRRHPDGLVKTLISDGESTTCYDGQFFFDTDHVEGSSGSQSNDLTHNVATPSAPTQAEFEVALHQAIEALIGFKDDQGEPFLEEWQLNSSNLICMVPKEHRKAALQTVQAGTINNTDNILQNVARVAVNPRLTNNDRFYLFYTGAPIKPFIFQQRGFNDGQNLHVGMLGDNTETGFIRNTWVFGVDARYNVGYGLWQFAVLTTLT